MGIEKIEKLTKDYADARERLAGTVATLEGKMEGIKRQFLPAVKVQVRKAIERQAELKDAIGESPDLFRRPRTVIMHGIRVGLEKGKGKIEWDDDDNVVKLIKKHFPEQADILIKKTERPLKKALATLSAADLKKLGIMVEETGDQVVIRPVDSEVDKIVAALLKDESEEGVEDKVA
jgi:hypothetical protein